MLPRALRAGGSGRGRRGALRHRARATSASGSSRSSRAPTTSPSPARRPCATSSRRIGGVERFPDAGRVVSIGPVTSGRRVSWASTVHVEAERHDIDGLVDALLRDALAPLRPRALSISSCPTTDTDDEFVGVCHGVIERIAPGATVIDVAHDLRPRRRAAAAHSCCENALPFLPAGVQLAVVDPGVGTERRAVALRSPAGPLLVGPDNGLLWPAADRRSAVSMRRSTSALALSAATRCRPPSTAATCSRRSRRDLATGASLEEAGEQIDPRDARRAWRPLRPSRVGSAAGGGAARRPLRQRPAAAPRGRPGATQGSPRRSASTSRPAPGARSRPHVRGRAGRARLSSTRTPPVRSPLAVNGGSAAMLLGADGPGRRSRCVMRPAEPAEPGPAPSAGRSCTSTSRRVDQRPRAPARAGGRAAGTVVVAEQQTAGRGRQGRTWSAPSGPGADAVRIVPAARRGRWRRCRSRSPLAVCEACEEVARGACAIKWPNDVWVDGRKVAGILIEARPQEGWAVIGIGLNVDTTIEELGAELRDDRHVAADRLRRRTWTGEPRSMRCSRASRVGSRRCEDRPRSPAAYRERDVLHGRAHRAGAPARPARGRGARHRRRRGAGRLHRRRRALRLDAGEVHLDRQPEPGAERLGRLGVLDARERPSASAPFAPADLDLQLRLLLRRKRLLASLAPRRSPALARRAASGRPLRCLRRRLPFGKLRSSSRASADGLRAIRLRAPRSTSSASGRVRERSGQQCGGQPPVVLARRVDQPARVAPVRGAGRVDEQPEQPLRLGPALHRVLLVHLARVLRQPPEPGLRLVAAADAALGQRLQQRARALAALLARTRCRRSRRPRRTPPGRGAAAISASARWRSCGVAVALQAASAGSGGEARRSGSWWSIALARRQSLAATRAPASAAQACCSSGSRYSTAIRHSSRSKTCSRRSGSSVTGTIRRSTRSRRPRPRRTGPTTIAPPR